MSAIVPFAFEDHLFRALDRDGEPWFIAGDVAKILGHRIAPHLTRALDEDEKGIHIVDTPGGPQEVAVISEPGLYRAIIQRRASAKLTPEIRDLIARFQRWVFHEVLPTLRRTGRYAMPGASRHHHNGDTLPGQDTEYRRRLDTVSEARRLYGPARARLLYESLDLPEVPELPFGESEAAPAAAGDHQVADALMAFLDPREAWTGTAAQLLALLNRAASEAERRRQGWPGTPRALNNAIERTKGTLLRTHGIAVERGRLRDLRTLTLRFADGADVPA